jgi:hypothetical protein
VRTKLSLDIRAAQPNRGAGLLGGHAADLGTNPIIDGVRMKAV